MIFFVSIALHFPKENINFIPQVRQEYFNCLLNFSLKLAQRVFTEQQIIDKKLSGNEAMLLMEKKMIRFEQNEKLFIIFSTESLKYGESPIPSPFFIDYRIVPKYIQQFHQISSTSAMNDLESDRSTPTSKYIEERFRSLFKKELPTSDYVLTLDNVYKMSLILFRIKAGESVILMGETGCGKKF